YEAEETDYPALRKRIDEVQELLMPVLTARVSHQESLATINDLYKKLADLVDELSLAAQNSKQVQKDLTTLAQSNLDEQTKKRIESLTKRVDRQVNRLQRDY